MKKPKTIAREQRKFRAPDLQGMLQVLQGEESYAPWLAAGFKWFLDMDKEE